MNTDRAAGALLQQGRAAYRRRAWSEAYEAFLCADEAEPLGPADLDLLATCAYLTGREQPHRDSLERAHHGYVAAGDHTGAARAAFWLAMTRLLAGETGAANGWLSRAKRLIEWLDCVEHGYLLLPVAEQELARHASDAAYDASDRAAAIGERFADADLTACARHQQGRALLQQGRTRSGLELLDEVMLAATAGELSPIVTGLIYCSVLEACRQVWALNRAREWTSAFTRWCERQPDLQAFTGTCLVLRAEILQFQGAWPDASVEAARACRRSERRPPAAAFYQRGEILRLQGHFAEAEEAYRDASRLGCEPQPGLALLRAAQGRLDAACAAIRRVVAATPDPFERARLLPAYVEIMLAGGDVEEARCGCAGLAELAARIDTDVLHALGYHARGAVELAGGDARTSLELLRRAFSMWQQLQAPYAAARARTLIGTACRLLGDPEAAGLELAAARVEFERLGAAPDLASLETAEKETGRRTGHDLTARELQVLRLIAAGQTNRRIARDLSLSERTIDRHVSNILTKLDVPSRAAAIAHAYNRKLF